MVHKKTYTIPFRRKKQGKTDYKKRLALLKSKSLRMVVRKSNKHMLVQLVKYGDKGDNVLMSAHTSQLEKLGWDINTGNVPAAYLVGYMLGTKAKGKEAILDLGLQTPISKSRLFATLKGAYDAGLKIKVSEEVFPDGGRITGKHIETYASTFKKDEFEKVYSGYLKSKKDPKKIQDYFEKTKKNIDSMVKK